MWHLYKNLEDSIPDTDEEYLIHEVTRILDAITEEKFKESLKLLDLKVETKINPVSVASFFIKGLTINNFFHFVSFIKRFHDAT